MNPFTTAETSPEVAQHYLVSRSGVERGGRLAPEQRPRLEAFCPATLAGQPVFIVLPGGAYRHHAEHEGRDVALWLNEIGLNAVVLHYSVAGDGVADILHPAPLQDAHTVLAWLRNGDSGLAIDSTRIGVMGFSAGGHLGATLSTATDSGSKHSQDRPDLAVLAYPVISMVSHAHEGSVAALLGPDPTPLQRRTMSAEIAVDAATPPTFLWHTSNDDAVPVENSLAYAAALASHDIRFELHVFTEGRHGLGLALKEQGGRHPAAEWAQLCRQWLQRAGWLTRNIPLVSYITKF